MKSNYRELLFILASIAAVMVGLLVGNSKVGMLISLVIAIFGFLNKERGLMLLIILIPIRPFLIEFNPGFKVLGDALVGLLFLRTLYDYRKDLKSLFVFHPFELAFLAFGIIGTISAFLTGVSLTSIIVQLRAYFLFYLLFYVVKRMDFSASSLKKLSVTTFVTAVVLSLHGFVEKISDKTMLMPEAWQSWPLSATNWMRVYGLIKGPNELSLYLLIAFIISLYLVKQSEGKFKYLVYTGLALIGTTILLTYSRGTLLTLIAFLLVYMVLFRKIKKIVPPLLIAALSVVLFTGVNQAADMYYDQYIAFETGDLPSEEEDAEQESKGKKRYSETFSDETINQSSNSGRIYYVKKAIEVFKDHPVIGTGFGTFGGSATLANSSPIYEEYGIESNFYSDNQYILILAETGVMGIIAILIVGYFLAAIAWKKRKEFYAPLYVYLLVAIAVGGAVYNILENDSFMMFFFILLGFIFQNKKLNDK